jgi:hypothetical protein
VFVPQLTNKFIKQEREAVMAKMIRETDVTGGPSEQQLMFSLFRPADANNSLHFAVTFTPRDDASITVLINRLEREDGSGRSWNIEGFIICPHGGRSYKMKGYYSSRKRTGHIEWEWEA